MSGKYCDIDSEAISTMLRRGVRPVSRPQGELVAYARMLEQIVGEDHDMLDFKVFHELFCPHWCDLLEKEEDADGR